MTLAVQIVAILFMLTMIFIAIWTFIIINKAYGHFKYQNYLLEKIAQNLSLAKRDKDISSSTTTVEVDTVKTDVIESDQDYNLEDSSPESFDDNITYLNT